MSSEMMPDTLGHHRDPAPTEPFTHPSAPSGHQRDSLLETLIPEHLSGETHHEYAQHGAFRLRTGVGGFDAEANRSCATSRSPSSTCTRRPIGAGRNGAPSAAVVAGEVAVGILEAVLVGWWLPTDAYLAAGGAAGQRLLCTGRIARRAVLLIVGSKPAGAQTPLRHSSSADPRNQQRPGADPRATPPRQPAEAATLRVSTW